MTDMPPIYNWPSLDAANEYHRIDPPVIGQGITVRVTGSEENGYYEWDGADWVSKPVPKGAWTEE
jgi:hypothetical protein